MKFPASLHLSSCKTQKNSYCLIFCEKSNLRWRLAGNLAPCSCAATVEYTVHSCCVLVAKPDLPPQSIHRLELTRAGLVEKITTSVIYFIQHWNVHLDPSAMSYGSVPSSIALCATEDAAAQSETPVYNQPSLADGGSEG
jgi:hypothetical protein